MTKTERTICLRLGILNLCACVLTIVLISLRVHTLSLFQIGNIPYLALVLFHFLAGVWMLVKNWIPGVRISVLRMLTEGLFCYALLLFFFSYFFAENANMDYAQRFAQSSGNLELAVDSTQERLVVLLRFGPHLLALLIGYVLIIPFLQHENIIQRYALPIIFLGATFRALAMPSGIAQEGIGILAWVSLVPLFLVIRYTRYKQALFFTVVYGAFTVIFTHYWLGTFSFVSLQFSVFVRILYYVVFFIPGLYAIRRVQGFIVTVLIWTIFEWYLHQGFAAFPWGVLPHTQYQNIMLIQIVSLTGIWGLSFLIALVNVSITELLAMFINKRPRKVLFVVLPTVLLCLLVMGFGFISLMSAKQGKLLTRVALIQNNSDPRKHSYERTLSILKILTNQAQKRAPELIIWPETAIVPNIRRWSKEPEDSNEYTKVVHDFLNYQKNLGTWLLTGNDDYTLVQDGKDIIRSEYNAAVLFTDTGERKETYHKMKLVPFTEYFPYRKQLPWFDTLLLNFDVSFWEPGTHATVFDYPVFAFSTLICFEDTFPFVSRKMVRNGAEVLINLSNDYWAQDPVEAQQHYASAVFRAVEHRRPFLRATTSGLTSYVDSYGRQQGSIGMYTPDFLIVDVQSTAEQQRTLYTRLGDWFVWLCMAALAVFVGMHLRLRFMH